MVAAEHPRLEPEEVLVVPMPKSGEAHVFTANDAGVTPPTPNPPRPNLALQPEDGAENLSVVDLIISDRGEVESVKLASPVRDYREAMMLSAVKAWRFKPATLDGMPVRFQLRVYLSVTSLPPPTR